MRNVIVFWLVFLGFTSLVHSKEISNNTLDYEKMILLDAEDLAEHGILSAYAVIKPELAKYVEKPIELTENPATNIHAYQIIANGEVYDIYGPTQPDDECQSLGRATYALFKIVNDQLKNSDVKFYAFNSGNNLGGMFLSAQQYQEAIVTLPTMTDWPYLPNQEHPWYGQPN